MAVERRERSKVTGPNQVWSLDFVADQLADGRRFRALTVMDVHTRESLAIEPGQSWKGPDVVRVLQSIQKDRGGPKRLLWLYNEVLRERKASWKTAQLSVSRFDQFKSLTLRRQADPAWRIFPLAAYRSVIIRVDLAFQAFFRRCKAMQQAGSQL